MACIPKLSSYLPGQEQKFPKQDTHGTSTVGSISVDGREVKVLRSSWTTAVTGVSDCLGAH